MKTLSVIEDSLRSGLALNHSLAIKFSSTEVIYAFLDRSRNTFVAVESRNLAENFGQSILMEILADKGKGNFGKVVVLIDNPVFSIVPDELFVKEDEKKYLSLTHTFQWNEKTENDTLGKINSHNVYWLPFDMMDFAKKHFLIYEYRHFSTVFMSYCLSYNKNQDAVYAYVCNSFLYLVAVKDKKPVLCNAYEYHAAEDLVYHVMNIFQKLEFNTKSTSLFISGESENMIAFKAMASTYVSKVIFFVRPSECNYGKGIAELPPYFGSVLFSTFSCA